MNLKDLNAQAGTRCRIARYPFVFDGVTSDSTGIWASYSQYSGSTDIKIGLFIRMTLDYFEKGVLPIEVKESKEGMVIGQDLYKGTIQDSNEFFDLVSAMSGAIIFKWKLANR